MFTGVIQAVGHVAQLTPEGSDMRLRIEAGGLPLDDVQPGDSIALNGACMTVVQVEAEHFAVLVSAESLRCTVGLDTDGALLNLEKALRLADRLGGHLVSGHVDGVGQVQALNSLGACTELVLCLPAGLIRYVAAKGSLAVHGVSLTTNWVRGDCCGINLIPHTLQQTNLHTLQVGDPVNIEVDLLARYCERLLNGG